MIHDDEKRFTHCTYPGCPEENQVGDYKFCPTHSTKGKEKVTDSKAMKKAKAELLADKAEKQKAKGITPTKKAKKVKGKKEKKATAAMPEKAKKVKGKKAKTATPSTKKVKGKKGKKEKKEKKGKKGKKGKKATPAQVKASKAASKITSLDWPSEIKAFKKGKAKTMQIEMGSPGSAQVTRVRLLQDHKGFTIATKAAFMHFTKTR